MKKTRDSADYIGIAINSLVFVAPTIIVRTVLAYHSVYIENVIDSKFSDAGSMFGVLVGAAVLVSIFLYVTFFFASFVTTIVSKINLSKKMSLFFGAVVIALTLGIGNLIYNFLKEPYDPVVIGNIIIILFFIYLNIRKKLSKYVKLINVVRLP